MSYVKYCDVCGEKMGAEDKISVRNYAVLSPTQKHDLTLEIRLSSSAGMGDFHSCRRCAHKILSRSLNDNPLGAE